MEGIQNTNDRLEEAKQIVGWRNRINLKHIKFL